MRVPWRENLAPAVLLALVVACSGPAADSPETSVGRREQISLLALFPSVHLEAVGPSEPLVRGVVAGGDELAAIQAPPPSRLRFPGVRIPVGGRLGFRVGVRDGARCRDGARFRLSADRGGAQPVPLWEGTASAGAGWEAFEVDLAQLAGGTVDLILETEAGKRHCDGASWGTPRIRAGEAAAEAIRRQVVRSDVLALTAAGEGGRRTARLVLSGPGTLELSGELRSPSFAETRAPNRVEFVARLDGEVAFRRSVESRGKVTGFTETIPLAAGRGAVELSLEIDGEPLLPARARWTRAWLLGSEEVRRVPAGDGPNLLLILVDALRADRLGIYGRDRPTSPALDRFAAEALVFENAISQCSWTLPAVASVLTGLYPLAHGVSDGVPLDPFLGTLQQDLQAAGFTTLGLSASPVVGRLEGFHRGFETFVEVPWARAESINETLREWLDANRGTRWFAYVHHIDPHDPYEAPEPYASQFAGSYDGPFRDTRRTKDLFRSVNFFDDDVPFGDVDIEYLRAAYDGEIRYWDEEFGKLMGWMEEEGLLQDTVVVITSDHGEEFLEHGKLKHGFQLYEESVRVPLILWDPARIDAGRSPAQVETRWLRSSLSWLLGVGATPPAEASLLTGDDRARVPAYTYTNHAVMRGERGRRTLAAVRDTDWKLIFRLEDEASELYRLAEDPAERRDLAPDRSARLGDYRMLIDRWIREGIRHAPDAAAPDPAMVEKLRSLGYVQ